MLHSAPDKLIFTFTPARPLAANVAACRSSDTILRFSLTSSVLIPAAYLYIFWNAHLSACGTYVISSGYLRTLSPCSVVHSPVMPCGTDVCFRKKHVHPYIYTAADAHVESYSPGESWEGHLGKSYGRKKNGVNTSLYSFLLTFYAICYCCFFMPPLVHSTVGFPVYQP